MTEEADYDAIILRSYKMSEAELTDKLCAVARAGAGVNNIPVELYSKKGVVVFNTPGANANAVKELVILGMLLSTRKVAAGIEWLKSQKDADVDIEKEVESQKSAYAGPEILNKSVGVIGLGAIGTKVANALNALGMKGYGYDPYLSLDGAWSIDKEVKRVTNFDWLLQNCDFLTIHVPLNDQTRDTINSENLKNAKDGIRIINLARGGLCNDEAIVEGIVSGKIGCYVTDFPNEKLLGYDNIIAIPHLGASTPESETNCAIMAAEQITDFLTNGNIKNSVNYPTCHMGSLSAKARLTVCHKNIPNMVGQITAVLAADKINSSDMMNKSKGDYAYTMIDVDNEITEKVMADLSAINDILKVRKNINS
jgi:D-3-phosphoglycerate dehydrogenase